ncbi:uncharacterized protein LAESUDRAFT_721983 [Laetiporus sulphureus 93-53]|uniref:2'-phosphotransferase n=1 Tax=Laetiporus sulphureus 93-53 TaxID=1314785 RepID=A0A165G4T2_9APHY|nr:uncharacterized protein LAESUDRAFT_721983 [Laetiporus sulphureus 93-53]KZT09829.1 hypothetical protein LAESUDRAFT_721983 [Laetiporus sulphureus 93-53]
MDQSEEAQTEKREKKHRAHGGSAKLRGHPRDSPETRMSKTLSWMLRHGAKSEGLVMRSDGYVRVDDLLKRPKMKDLNFEMLQEIVKNDNKNRYNLLSEPDRSSDSPEGIWWIRANQGHSIKSVALDLQPINSPADISTGIAVHGTSTKAWEYIRSQGLSKMNRNHIHLAQGVPGSGVISGMRASSQLLIYVDVQKALDAGIKFYLSANGVVLTEGDENGFLSPEFFARVETSKGKPLPGWEDTQPVRRLDGTDVAVDKNTLAIAKESTKTPGTMTASAAEEAIEGVEKKTV